jgi:site-specific recombinase XerD
MAHGELIPTAAPAGPLVPAGGRDSLEAWLGLYMGLEAGACSENTFRAKQRDLQGFLNYFAQATGSDHPDQWTRSLTAGYLKALAGAGKKPTTVNRVLASMRHAAAWVHRQRPFLAGNPTDRLTDVQTDEPSWKGLSDLEVTRLKSAAEQLLCLKTAANQHARRDHAIFLLLLCTGLRVSELLSLDLNQYQGKHFLDVRRKGRKVSARVFLAQEARDALDRYLDEARGRQAGPLFTSRSGKRLRRSNVDDALKALANQANTHLAAEQKVHLSAHVLRHTMLRRAAEKNGVQFAMELSGHSSSNYIWRYVKPSDEQKERAVEELF